MIYFKRARLLAVLFFVAYCVVLPLGFITLLHKKWLPAGTDLLNPWFLIAVLVVTGAVVSLLVYRLLFNRAEFHLHNILYISCAPARFLDEAFAVYERFPRETGLRNRLKTAICISYLADGQIAKAKEMLGELEHLPASLQPEALCCKGWCALTEGDIKTVREQILAVKAAAPDSERYLDLENTLLVHEEKYTQAQPRLEAQLNRCSTPCQTVACHMLLAQVYDGLGQSSKARESLEYVVTYGNTMILAQLAGRLLDTLDETVD